MQTSKEKRIETAGEYFILAGEALRNGNTALAERYLEQAQRVMATRY